MVQCRISRNQQRVDRIITPLTLAGVRIGVNSQMMNTAPRTHWQTYYHVIWRTKNSEPLLTPEVRQPMLNYVRLKCAELECPLLAVNAMEDHVHLLCSIPPKLAAADVVKHLKDGSSLFVNKELQLPDVVQWQRGYGLFTVSTSHIHAVRSNVDQQEQRHRARRLIPSLERAEESCRDLDVSHTHVVTLIGAKHLLLKGFGTRAVPSLRSG